MKKITSFAITLILLLALAGCRAASAARVYSFSGESDELRVINGVAVIGGENETFYGGELEIKNDSLQNAVAYDMNFYVSDGTEAWTLLSMTYKNEANDALKIENQEIGQITGAVLNENMDESALQNHLYFDLLLTDENGKTQTYTVPMEVTEVTAAK